MKENKRNKHACHATMRVDKRNRKEQNKNDYRMGGVVVAWGDKTLADEEVLRGRLGWDAGPAADPRPLRGVSGVPLHANTILPSIRARIKCQRENPAQEEIKANVQDSYLELPPPTDRRNCEVEVERGVPMLTTAAVRAADDLVGEVRVEVDGDSRNVARAEGRAVAAYKLANVEDGGPRADIAPL
jgi:hypothetical protein